MKAAEVHKFSAEEIKVEATRLRRRLFDLRSQSVTEKIEDTSQYRKSRKDLARVLTELNSRSPKTKRKATPADTGAASGGTS
ncbi:MAG: 50S ribosomal protein L29 [Phycisphaerae bacterium]|nr:50S ribosomal protein L29 [Phycisphaerae bacterium]